ncbi:Tetraacyldisaccharide 4'-kinase [bacterium HR15]|nr:Tetraacyldisaccharide 4'-kinase [bacterium HR15]
MWDRQPPPLLRGLAWLYANGWRIYEHLYHWGIKRRVRLPVPIVGVGSLLVGGAGKTPVAIAIARQLHESGRHVAVLCSGYSGRRFNTITLLEPGETPDPIEVGDEPVEILNALREVPIAVGRRRVAVAQAALARWQPEVLVLDDGFQHLPLARTVDLVVLPAVRPFGNGYCLPAGPLREPPAGLQRADAILQTRYTYRQEVEPPSLACVAARANHLPLFEAMIEPEGLEDLATGQLLPPDALYGHEVVAIAGIARAYRFLQTAEQLGIRVVETRLFPDHYPFEREDWGWARARTLLTTAKDATKLRARLPAECRAYALRIHARLEPAFCNWLLERLHFAV